MANRHKILVMDDNKLIRRAIQIALDQAAYEVRGVGTEDEAEELLTTWFPHTILCDLDFAGIPGDLLCSEIKRRLRVHTLLFSSLPREELSKRAQATGADGFISKLEGFDHIRERLVDILRSAPPPKMTVADLEMRDIHSGKEHSTCL